VVKEWEKMEEVRGALRNPFFVAAQYYITFRIFFTIAVSDMAVREMT